MPDTAKLTLVKTIPWRGGVEEWSNSYHFTGPTPGSTAAWKTLSDAWWDLERSFLSGDVKLVRAYGYEPGNEVNVWTNDYTLPPIAPVTAQGPATGTGELCLTVAFTTSERNSKGRPVRGMKYYHGAIMGGTSVPTRDTVNAVQVTATNTGVAKMFDGTLPAGVKYCMPQGATVTAGVCKSIVGEHQFKRRGKRPH